MNNHRPTFLNSVFVVDLDKYKKTQLFCLEEVKHLYDYKLISRYADERIRTSDPRFTIPVLYQLSYVGMTPTAGLEPATT